MATEYLSPSEFENVCRVCLKQHHLQSIFAYKIAPRKPAEDLGFKFKQCSGLGCEPTDGLPAKICLRCYEALVAAYNFRSLCVQSAETLERSLKEHAEDNKSHIILLTTPNIKNDNDSEENSNKIIKEEKSDFDIELSECSDNWADEPTSDYEFGEIIIKKSSPRKIGKRKSKDRKSLEESVFENGEISEMNTGLSELQKFKTEEKSDSLANESFEEILFEEGEISEMNTNLSELQKFNTEEKIDNLANESLEESLFEDGEVSEMNTSLSELRKFNTEEKSDSLANKGVVSCPRCEAKFATVSGLELHVVEAHSFEDQAGYNCYGCDAVFPTELERGLHEEGSCPNMPPGTQYCCRLCPTKVDSRAQFDSHLEGHRVTNFIAEPSPSFKQSFYRCPDCPYTSRNADQANAHRLRHRGVRPFSCPRASCAFRTDLRNSLAKHEARHIRLKPLACPQCPYRAWGLSHLRRHVKQHESWDKCQICDASFNTKQQLLDHGASEHGAVKFTYCPICNKFFSGKARRVDTCHYIPGKTSDTIADDKCLSTDEKDVSTAVVENNAPIERETHGKIIPTSECTLCSEMFLDEKLLHKHVTLVHDKLPTCEFCGKQYTKVAHLKKHSSVCCERKTSDTIADDKCLSTDEKDVSTAVVENNAPIERETHGKIIPTSEVRYSCNSCDFTTRLQRYLTSHMRIHESEPSYKCHMCPFRSRYAESLRGHLRRHSRRSPNQCMLCSKMFLDEKLLQKHVALVHDKPRNHTCKFCGKQYTKVAHLKKHSSVCCERLSSNVEVAKEKEEVSVEQFKCETCGLMCNSSSSLSQHALSHAESVQMPQPLMCGACPFVCSTQAALRRHARVHAARKSKGKHAVRDKEIKKQECSMCQQSFPSRVSLLAHVRSAHPALMRYQCPWCEARYFGSGGYYRHVPTCLKRPPPPSEHDEGEIKKVTTPRTPIKKVATPQPPIKKDTTPRPRMAKGSFCAYVCEICGQILGSKNSHDMHMNRHAGKQRVYSCERCPYTSASSDSLRAHRLRHEGLKPYACSLCPYRTDMKGSLAVHARMHAGDLRHACRLCPYRAVNVGNLKRHMAQHTHNKPHQCEQCDGSFFDKKTLSDHIAYKHEGVKTYSCPHCAVLFSRLKGQQSHLRKFHPGAPKGSGRATGAPLEGQIQAGSQIGEQIGSQIGGQMESQAMGQLEPS